MPVRTIEATDDGEESVAIRIAGRMEAAGRSVNEFWCTESALAQREGYLLPTLPAPMPYRDLPEYVRSISDRYLRQLADLPVSDDCEFPTYLLTDVWNECHIIVETPDAFVSYVWGTGG